MFYELLWDQTPIGQQRQTLEALPDGTWQWHSVHQIRATVRQTTIDESLDELFVFDGKPPYRFRFGEIRRNDALYILQNDAQFTVKRDDVTVLETATLNYGLRDVLFALQSIANGPQIGQTVEWTQFDTQQFRLLPVRVEVIAQDELDGQSVWHLALSSPEQTYRSEMWARHDGVPYRLSNGAIEMHWRDTLPASNTQQADLYQLQTIPINRALGDSKTIASLSLRWPQQIVLPLQQRADQFVDVGFVRTELKPSPRASIEEKVAALSAETRYSSEQTSFVQRAKALTQSLHDDEARVRALLIFVSEHLMAGTELREQTAAEILRSKTADCTEYAQLFVALARANGLSAREVSGLVYLGDSQQRFGGHTWAEVVVDGRWQSVDPMWNLYGITATHLRMGEGEQGALATLVHDGRLRFDVDDIRYKQ